MTRNTEQLSIEKVHGLLEKATAGPWTYDHPGGHYERGGEIVEEYSRLYEVGHDDGTVAHDIVSAADAELLSLAPDLARLCLSLAAQLQQEREVRERLEKALEWYAEPSIYQQEHFEGTGMEYPALVDGGHSARLALSAAEAPAGRDT